jgi:hypothetical protein
LSEALPSGIDQAFTIAAAELGMCSASWLYVGEVAQALGPPGVEALRERLGRPFPVLDAVGAAWLDGVRAPSASTQAVQQALTGAKRVVLVGLETRFLDALLPKLPEVQFALLQHGTFDVDWERVLANYGGRLTPLDFDRFQAWAGAASVLLTFAYGVHGASTHVVPSWLRVTGEDVRTQFRSLIAWDVLGAPMWVYPRWLVEVPQSAFTRVIAS